MISAVNARQYAERFVQFLSTATLFDPDADADAHDAHDLASDSAAGVAGVPSSTSAPMVLVSAAPEQIEMTHQVSSTSSS